MNSEQLMGMLRVAIPPLAAAVSHWGIGTDAQNTAVITAIAIGVSGAWDAYTNSQTALIKSVNNADNGVSVVPTKSAAAAGIPPVDVPLKK
jgi:hypothetical protein